MTKAITKASSKKEVVVKEPSKAVKSAKNDPALFLDDEYLRKYFRNMAKENSKKKLEKTSSSIS
jgi:hypothetical protein